MLKWLRLPSTFDVVAMQSELAAVDASLWTNHYNTGMYQGGWQVLPLRSLGGSLNNIVAVHQGASRQQVYQDTALLDHCPYIRSVLNFFECPKTSVRFMKLNAGAVIHEHTDHAMCFEEGEARLHIPVITNEAVAFLLENERMVMREGECWYLNLSLKHSVRNYSSMHRVHLVIDLLVNDWVRQLFASQGANSALVAHAKPPVYSCETQRQIIAQLREMNTATSLALADKMDKEFYG